jgi:arylsulfatase A-like enzyme
LLYGDDTPVVGVYTPTSLTQIFPTLTDLCSIPTPPKLDGESLVRDLRELDITHDTAVFSEFRVGRPNAKFMIRRGDFKFNFYREDSKEVRNLSPLTEYGCKVEEMKFQLFVRHKPRE